MNDPRRLAEGDGTGLERLLVDAVRRERPAPPLRTRMVQALGFDFGGSPRLDPRAEQILSAAKTGTGAWLALGITVGVAAAVASVAVAMTSLTSGRTAPAAKLGAGKPHVAEPAVVPPAEGTSGGALQAMPPGDDQRESALADEIRLLDATRTFVAGRRAREALAALDTYFARHAGGTLEPEARALQIDALLAAGRIREARRAGREFLRRHPAGPLADRVRGHQAPR